jgi:ferric-dicitrate binding protein FerR (iron transport regulator)
MDISKIKITPQWSKNKKEIWNETFKCLSDNNSIKPAKTWTSYLKYAAILVIAVLLFGSLYKVENKTAFGQHLTICLPDNSQVTLNAGSKITYSPCLWFVLRSVKLEGEAFFKVKKGSRFRVVSGRNQVYVRGTTFNIFTRPEMYRVTCLTGQVEVHISNETFPLSQGMQVTLRSQNTQIEKNIVLVTDWRNGKFVFTETPLAEVIAEIERQYDIRVTTDKIINQLYTGHFSKTEQAEDALEIVGKPFSITFKIEK